MKFFLNHFFYFATAILLGGGSLAWKQEKRFQKQSKQQKNRLTRIKDRSRKLTEVSKTRELMMKQEVQEMKIKYENRLEKATKTEKHSTAFILLAYSRLAISNLTKIWKQ